MFCVSVSLRNAMSIRRSLFLLQTPGLPDLALLASSRSPSSLHLLQVSTYIYLYFLIFLLLDMQEKLVIWKDVSVTVIESEVSVMILHAVACLCTWKPRGRLSCSSRILLQGIFSCSSKGFPIWPSFSAQFGLSSNLMITFNLSVAFVAEKCWCLLLFPVSFTPNSGWSFLQKCHICH